MTKSEFIKSYIDDLETILEIYQSGLADENDVYELIHKVRGIFLEDIPQIDNSLTFRHDAVERDASILIGILKLNIINSEEHTAIIKNNEIKDTIEPLIFLSHKSDDKIYADALERFITGLGVKNNQLIYSSHPLHKIPLDVNIYDYLRKNIYSKIFMIILWSNRYLESPACLNEMGAAWVVQSDYTNIYVPSFSFGNPKYHECAVDTRKMGAVLNGDSNCKASMIELKNKIQSLFNLADDEQKTQFLLDNFIKEIMTEANNNID